MQFSMMVGWFYSAMRVMGGKGTLGATRDIDCDQSDFQTLALARSFTRNAVKTLIRTWISISQRKNFTPSISQKSPTSYGADSKLSDNCLKISPKVHPHSTILLFFAAIALLAFQPNAVARTVQLEAKVVFEAILIISTGDTIPPTTYHDTLEAAVAEFQARQAAYEAAYIAANNTYSGYRFTEYGACPNEIAPNLSPGPSGLPTILNGKVATACATVSNFANGDPVVLPDGMNTLVRYPGRLVARAVPLCDTPGTQTSSGDTTTLPHKFWATCGHQLPTLQGDQCVKTDNHYHRR
jgi:hypothetical protein